MESASLNGNLFVGVWKNRSSHVSAAGRDDARSNPVKEFDITGKPAMRGRVLVELEGIEDDQQRTLFSVPQSLSPLAGEATGHIDWGE